MIKIQRLIDDAKCYEIVRELRWQASGHRCALYPHRGISQEQLPLYRAFVECVHNIRRRGKALLGSLLASLLVP